MKSDGQMQRKLLEAENARAARSPEDHHRNCAALRSDNIAARILSPKKYGWYEDNEGCTSFKSTNLSEAEIVRLFNAKCAD
nr:hypothetical protein J4W40_000335 [Escherichia coli]